MRKTGLKAKFFISLFAVFLYLLPSGVLYAADFNPGGYGNVSDYLDSIYGIDENAGLTAFPILNIPMGGRAEGMAGAFAAVANDATLIEWNPAGSSTIEVSELAFYHNNWIADAKIEGLSYVGRYKNLGFGLCTKWLYMPFTQYNYFGERLSKGYYVEGMAALNFSYNLFPGYYFGGLSIGVNIKGAFRMVPDFASGITTDNSSGTIESGSGKSQSAASVMADAGLLSRFNFLKFYKARDRNLTLALVLKNLGLDAIDDPLPTVAVAAISYKPLRPLIIAFDYSIPMNVHDISLSEKHYFSTGLSVDVASFLAMRAGVLFKAGGMRACLGTSVTLGKLSLDINYTLDLATQAQPFNRIAVGAKLNLSDGGRRESRSLVDKYYLAGLDAYSKGDDGEARKWFGEALSINPHFDPAKEGLRAINNYEDLVNRIQQLERNLNF
ncbi:MAG: UPF0164 family protein [Termitinemataceae bacterium]|nr:MAG: UPF0164 family protein [Termitinemataceae bacterium]